MFETILNNPGLQHLAENIFFHLDVEHLQLFGLLNQSSRQILEGRMFQDPMFWLQKFEGISIDNQDDWSNVIQSANNSFKRKFAIISYLRWNLKKEAMVNLACYSNPAVQADFRMKIQKICEKKKLSDEDTEIIKIFAPMTDNPNAPGRYRRTPIDSAAVNG